MPAPVVIAKYDPRWPLQFVAARSTIMQAVGPLVVSIEHIGSTVVPGLAAKPIVDIMPGLQPLEDGYECVAPLEALGYEYSGENGIPGRHYFDKYAAGDSRTQHVHMVVAGSDFWTRNILFRDYLRTHPGVAEEYARLKYSLAERYRSDRVAYTESKSGFIEGVLQRASAEGTEADGERPRPIVEA